MILRGFLFHIVYCGGVTPVVMLPIHGGYGLGLFSFFHIYIGYQMIIGITLLLS
ncbi:MAG: hypothetical protein DI548_07445 [Flavobacterium johnsoniae]|nr:MAG: hypothetical protein DI548_07445 [Flavobacterium johnsoniae]